MGSSQKNKTSGTVAPAGIPGRISRPKLGASSSVQLLYKLAYLFGLLFVIYIIWTQTNALRSFKFTPPSAK